MSDLVFHLARGGIGVCVITSRGLYDDAEANLPAFETRNGVAIHRVCSARFGRRSLIGRAIDYLSMYRSFALAVWRLARAGDLLIVKTDPPLLSVALAPVARLKKASLINWLQDLYPELALKLGVRALTPVAPLLVAARNASLRMAVCNVVIGERMRLRLEALGVAPERIETIPNWCDDELISSIPPESNPLRSAWGLQDRLVIGYSGNLGRAHEFATLLGAADELRDERGIVFLFIGGGHLTPRLKAEVERKGLGEMFQFRPYQDVSLLPQSLSVPDVHWISLQPAMEGLIVPSKFYGVAAVGRPTFAICDPEGEIARLVTRHDCGVVIAPGDSAGLANAIRAARDNPARRAEMGRNARNLLDRSFRKQYALERWKSLFERVGEEA